MTGHVKFFDPLKKWGFITPLGASRQDEEVFVHIKECRMAGIKTLNAGDLVQFEILTGNQGETRAIHLKLMASTVTFPPA